MTIAFQGLPNENLQANQNILTETGVPPKNSDIFKDMGLDVFQPTDDVYGVTPKLNTARVLMGRLTPEQIYNVNTSKKLPKNAKFTENSFGKISLSLNFFDITKGTHKLPAGYELKNDILGFTHVVREGTKCWYLKENPSPIYY